METGYRIAAVIINYKTPQLCLKAVESLFSELDPDQDCIAVVDNCSNDGSLEQLQCALKSINWSGHIEVMCSDFNGGFSYGNNFAMSKIYAEAYFLLNSDALVLSGAIQTMWNTLQENPQYAIIGPLVLDASGNEQVSCFNDHTMGNQFLETAKTGILTKLFGRFGVNEVVLASGKPVREVDWLSFVCVLIRGKAYQDIGPMDDGYFMYKEDNDYCRRARENGWKVLYLPNAKVIHLNKGWSAKQLERKPAFFYESRARYFRKFYGLFGFFMANFLWTLGRLIYWFREIIQNKPKVTANCAWLDIWTLRIGSKPIAKTESSDNKNE